MEEGSKKRSKKENRRVYPPKREGAKENLISYLLGFS
jgi:hypothetical protein